MLREMDLGDKGESSNVCLALSFLSVSLVPFSCTT